MYPTSIHLPIVVSSGGIVYYVRHSRYPNFVIQVPVYEFKIDGDSVMRRRADDWVNATHILKAAGFDKPARTRILEREVQKGVHEKVQGGYGKYQGMIPRRRGNHHKENLAHTFLAITGTWIPLPEGRLLAERNNILAKLLPIFDFVAGDRSPPPAPKHSSAPSKPRAPRKSTNRSAATEIFNVVQPQRSMGPPTLPHEQYEMSAAFDDNDSIEQATLESSSMIADEDMLQMSQHGGRKRKRGMNEGTVMSITEQEHIMYGDQLLDYFMTVGDAPQATRIHPPEPPAHFQIDRPIDDSGNTALHWACAMGDLEIVQDLLRRGADVKALSVHEETPLVRAVLFTNNYEKRTFPTLLDLLLDTVSFRDWFGATLFHHVAETTRSKGKWKSSRYYCEVLLDKLCKTCSQDEIDLLLSCQDDNGDTAALVASRNGAFRLVNMLLMHCPRAGDLMNKKGETATSISQQSHHVNHDIPPAPSSVTMANDHIDGAMSGLVPSDRQSVAPPVDSTATSELLSKIGTIMSEANKKLTVTYGNSKVNQQDSTDVANPEALFEQLESDRQKIQAQVAALAAKEAHNEHSESQTGRYEKLRVSYESLLEQVQYFRLAQQLATVAPTEPQPADPSSLSQNELVVRYQIARELCAAQKARRGAVKDLAQQTADAGVSTKFDVHRKLVALATGLKEEELDPMAAELAETLEFDRMNGKGASPELEHRRFPSQNESAALPSGPSVPVDA
ncbi:KilA N-terminal/APSES-type HTH DNA-binding [Penicillium hispanicum]|uniref:KilA N-terminal/APSES-type HTH DNA-binding n=1 Tax=Penicillium hispanicum TaxID=1080232 RepID=UPI00253F8CEC|nr:KilA N-terminal/APSES-type HTH DNA-binding [Penicillium hispanicum]KAJ5594015.1 KilA N-terminal/APSES-type HTH DNA-binding [Penicillium hispanicum]